MHRDVPVATSRGLDPAPERDHAGGQVEGLLAEHRRHARRVGLVRGDLLHRELVLPDPVDERGEYDVVEEAVVLEVERGEKMGPRLHRQDLLDHVGGFGVRDRRPVGAREQMDHLVAVAQLLGHDAQRPRVILRLLRPRERALVLLDGAELGRCLRLDLHQEVLRGLLGQIFRRERLRLALAFADLDLRRDVLGDLGAEAERLVLREEAVPLLGELGIVREVVPLPVLDRIVVLLRKRPEVVLHTSSVPTLSPNGHTVRCSERACA